MRRKANDTKKNLKVFLSLSQKPLNRENASFIP
jgi:hypothetical protein